MNRTFDETKRDRMALSKSTKVATAAVIVVIAAIAVYSLFPYVASTKVSNLQNDQTTYIYGTVVSRNAFGNTSVFGVNDTSGTVYVVWNGTLPANGEKVLVHGTYRGGQIFFLKYGIFEATSVTPWPI